MPRSYLGIFLVTAILAGYTANALGSADQSTRHSNVLMIAIDDLNDWVGFLRGHPQAYTPNMDRLAKRGIIFANAHCAAPVCCPSRAAVFSGRQPFHTGVYSNDQNIQRRQPRLVLLPQHFKASGYRTLGTGKLLHRRRPDLFDESFFPHQRWSPFTRRQVAYTPEELPTKGQRPHHVVHWGPNRPAVVLPLNRMPSDRSPNDSKGESFDWGPVDVGDSEMGDGKVADWTAAHLLRRGDSPFFLAVGFYRPHIPLFAPATYFKRFPTESTTLPRVLTNDLDDLSDTGRKRAIEAVTAGLHDTVVRHGQWKAAVAGYLACVAFVDAQVGKLLDALDHGPNADNTWVVLFSDHGWHLGEKQHWGKSTGWERSTRVPLVVVPPKAASNEFRVGGVCDEPVGLIDLYPTLVDLCNLNARPGLDGQSLRPRLRDPDAQTDRSVITTFGKGNYTVRDRRWRLIRYADGSQELYDHQADPREWKNLAGDSNYAAIQQRLTARLPMTGIVD